MKIVFNLLNVGLGNNGGSRTIIKCANVLSSLGQDVTLLLNQPNGFTWSKIKSKVLYGDNHPPCDVSIATGFKSLKSTIKSPAAKKYCYVRGLERWVVNEKELFRMYKKVNCIVNSEWLRDYFSKNGISSKLIYPGLDFDRFHIINGPRVKDLGALYSKRHTTKRHCDAQALSISMRKKFKMLNKNIVNASEESLRLWYNKIKVWFSPSELEGLHNPPMEAGLCGCALVCTDHYMSGVLDFAVNRKTALIYPARNLQVARSYIEELLGNETLRNELNKNLRVVLKNKIGSRKENMSQLIRHVGGK